MKKIIYSPGEPAGIGPDICVLMAEKYINKNHIVITDPSLLEKSADKLKLKVNINIVNKENLKTYYTVATGPKIARKE